MAEEGGSSIGERWYYSRKEIEENSPSRRDGIDRSEITSNEQTPLIPLRNTDQRTAER